MTADPMTTDPTGEDLLWPRYAEPADLAAIEAVPLAARGLPESTYALLARAATPLAGRARRSPSCRRRPAGRSRCGGPSPNCWPTSTATRTCSTGSASAAATRSR